MKVESPSRRITASVVATGALVVAMLAGGSTSAQADIPTAVTFDGSEATVEFGATWTIELAVTSEAGLLDTPDGTIDIFVEGIAGPFASGVPIHLGGEAFVTQPSGSPLLGTGDHHFSAIFRPAAGSGLVSSQSLVDYVLTVTSLAVDAHATMVDVFGEEGTPFLELGADGSFVDALGAPPGTWAVTVVDGSEQVLAVASPQLAGATERVRISLAEVTRPGSKLSIVAEFTPDPSVAPGVTVTQPQPVAYQVEGLTPVGFLAASLSVPWWAVVTGLLVLGGAVAWLVVILVRRRARPTKAT
jgi:hypothetical protein